MCITGGILKSNYTLRIIGFSKLIIEYLCIHVNSHINLKFDLINSNLNVNQFDLTIKSQQLELSQP